MNYKITSAQAAIILQVLQKVEQAQAQSLTVMALIGIDSHDILNCRSVINELKPLKNKPRIR